MLLPTRIGRYEILSLLGQGAMGAVYKAHDPVLDRVVAVKTVSPVLLAFEELREEYLERFRREAKAAGRLSYPNIVSVYDLGLDEATATPFIVMEYVAGVSLETVLKENPGVPFEQAMEIVDQVAAALDEAHRYGVVHRDIKPANVFFDARGRVKVGDFGVARLEGSELTQAGVGLGTPGYLAPEVVRGGVAGPGSDVFALGVLAYRLFTGERPFAGATREALAIDVLEREPRPPSAIRPELPEHVSNAVMRALAKSPEARTASAEAFARELRGPAGDVSKTTTVRTPRMAATSTPADTRSHRWLLLAALAALVLALGAGTFLLFRGSRAEQGPAASAPTTMGPRAGTPAPLAGRQRAPTAPPRSDTGSRRATPVAPAVGSPRGETADDPDAYPPAQRKAEEQAEALLKKAQEWAQELERKTRGKGHGRDKKEKRHKD